MKNVTLVLLLLNAACASVSSSFDYDQTANFEKSMTYGWDKHVKDVAIDQFNKTRIISAVEKEMEARDFSKADGPDFLIDLHLKLKQDDSATAASAEAGGYGRWGYGWGSGFSSTLVDYNKYANGTLFINVIDRASEKIVWQGRSGRTIDENLTPEKRTALIDEVVAAIFKNYPILPSSKK